MQGRLTSLQDEVGRLEAEHKQRMQTLKGNYDAQAAFYQGQLNNLVLQINDRKMEKKGLEDEIELLTGMKETVDNSLKFLEELKETVRGLIERVKALKQEAQELQAKNKAEKDQLEAKDAWINYLLSGKIPTWESTFWINLETMVKVKEGRLPEAPYLKPASEAVRKKLTDLLKDMVREDLIHGWDYRQLEEERDKYRDELQKTQKALADEKVKRTEAEKETKNLRETQEERISTGSQTSLETGWTRSSAGIAAHSSGLTTKLRSPL